VSLGAQFLCLPLYYPEIQILPAVLYGCETWSLILTKKRTLRVFENKVPRNIFGPKRDEVTGQWSRLHNKDLHALYLSPNIILVIKPRIRWPVHVARMRERSGAYGVLVRKPEGRNHLEDLGVEARSILK
jgi:hypothetical protein